MNNCLGIINLDENENRMGELVRYRTLASVPISGRYRVIDFVISNMANAGIEGIGIFTKNKSRSLINHLTNGRPWDLHRKKDGLRVFNFGDFDPLYDDIHNFADNIEFIRNSRRKYVLIAPSYMICNINYNEVLKKHKENNNDITIIYKSVNDGNENFIDCEVLNIDEDDKVLSIGENIGRDANSNINMEMYLMKTDLFIDMIYECIKSGVDRKIKHFIRRNLDNLKVGAFEFNGYLACINSIKAYFNANMDLLNEDINRELFFEGKPIYTKSQDEAPAKYTDNSEVTNSIIANGSYIEGTVKNCIIGRHVYIGKDTVIENCIIMQNSKIEDNVSMSKVIADKGTLVNKDQNINGTENYPVTIQKRKAI